MKLKDLKEMLNDFREPEDTPVVLRRKGKELSDIKGYTVTGATKSLREDEDSDDTVIILETYSSTE